MDGGSVQIEWKRLPASLPLGLLQFSYLGADFEHSATACIAGNRCSLLQLGLNLGDLAAA